MRDAISGLLGVPATILIAAGLGVVGVTVVSRIRGRRRPPMRWIHSALGFVLLIAGGALMALDVAILGVR